MPTAEEFFAPWESVAAPITGWTTMMEQIDRVHSRVGEDRTLAWRGLSRASYTAHSTLYRHLAAEGGSVDEDDMLRFETSMLEVARTRWRFDDRSALEILAQFQHLGAPTRLLDVTFNPLIALWFAVEPKYAAGKQVEDVDGRLIAFDVTDRQVQLSSEWGGREIPWASPPDGWRNELPRVWRPPAYNERIPAQDSGFLLGGVPGSGNSRFYRKRPGDNTHIPPWRLPEARAVTSVPMRMYSLDSPTYPRSKPTLTIRIPGPAKKDIRNVLDRRFGINTSSVYPDMYGLAQRGWLELTY